MNASIISQPKVRLITCKSRSFPEGNRAAFEALEAHLKSLRGRRFYGLVFENGDELEYWAGLVPDNELEERRFAALGFSIKEIEAGPCARVKLLDWMKRTHEIGPLFGALMERYVYDATRPQLEYYRSLTELHLLLPVVRGE